MSEDKLKLEASMNQIYELTVTIQNLKNKISSAKDDTIIDVLKKILPVLDNFDRAVSTVPKDSKDTTVQGFIYIHQQLNNILNELNVNEIPTKTFNSDMHEVVGKVKKEKDSNSEIAEVVEKGYMLGKKILREAKVKIFE